MKKTSIKSIIEDADSVYGRIFDLFIQVLIIVSIVSFSISTIPTINTQLYLILELIQVITVLIFSLEYLLRIIVADKKLKYIFSFYGIIDLISILPFYLTVSLDLRSLRAFRLLRLFRLFKAVRYVKAVERYRKAFNTIKSELLIFAIATVFLIYLSSIGIFYFENSAQPENFSSIFDSMWWSVATLTTVGYGDVYPITTGGKIFTFFILMVGLSVVAVPAGLFATALQEAHKSE